MESDRKNLFRSLSAESAAQRTDRNVTVTTLTQAVRFAIQLTSTIVIARLLQPEDFGLVAMVAVVTNFFLSFKDMGLSHAVVQAKVIAQGQASSLFWISVCASGLLYLLIIAISPGVAWIYGEERLLLITIISGATIVLEAPALINQALLQRNLLFGSIARAELLAHLLAMIVGITTAVFGAGVWSIVSMYLTLSFARSLLLWNQTRWVPDCSISFSSVSGFLGFGGRLTGFTFVEFFSHYADNFFIGKFLGAEALGHYSRAYQLMMLPIKQINAPISAALTPTLSRLHAQPEVFAATYLKWVQLLAWVTAIPIASMVLFGEELTVFLLGADWQLAGELFKWLALAAIFQPLANLTGVVFISLGQPTRMFRWGCFSTLVIIAAIVTGLPWGVKGVAIAYAIAINLLVPVVLVYHCTKTPVKFPALMRKIAIPGIIAISIATAGLISQS